MQLKSKIEKLELELKKARYSPFYSDKKQKLITYVEYVIEIENEKKKLIFDLSELTGTGNYKPIKEWSLQDIIDYTKLKQQQINAKPGKNTNNR